MTSLKTPSLPNRLTIAQALELLRAKQLSHQELYQALRQQISQSNDQLNVYLAREPEAEEIAHRYADLPLKGLPLAVKDNFSTQRLVTTASSKILDAYRPPYESTVTRRLQQAGGVVLGKTNLDAWAHGSSTETSDFGRSLNPRNTEYLPGGSSGGSAAAVAADLCLGSIGSETAGSIRQPASWCGVVGLKPSYGRVSRYGVVPMGSSLDSPGPITKTVEDAALLLNAMAGHDPLDATTSPQAVPDFTRALGQSIKGFKIGVLYLDTPGLEEVAPVYHHQLQVLSELGAELEPASGLEPRLAISVYTVVQRGEVSSNLAKLDGIRYGRDRSYFGGEAKRRILLGTFTLSKGYADKYYVLAQQVRTLFVQDFERLFQRYDVLVSPSTPGYAKKIGASEGATMFGELEDMLAEPSSITGLPGVSVPCYRDEASNLYLGLNVVAPMWREDLVIQVADAFERHTPWNCWRSPDWARSAHADNNRSPNHD